MSASIVSRKNKRRQMYWWSEEVASLRDTAVRARRLWIRSRRRGIAESSIVRREAYVTAKRALRNAIRRAKTASWAELISTIDSDPWGLPYKLVMGKLRRSSPALSETLDESTLVGLLDSLFPGRSDSSVTPEILVEGEEDDIEVSVVEIVRHVRKRPSKNTAPGPDNIKASVWKRTT